MVLLGIEKLLAWSQCLFQFSSISASRKMFPLSNDMQFRAFWCKIKLWSRKTYKRIKSITVKEIKTVWKRNRGMNIFYVKKNRNDSLSNDMIERKKQKFPSWKSSLNKIGIVRCLNEFLTCYNGWAIKNVGLTVFSISQSIFHVALLFFVWYKTLFSAKVAQLYLCQ